MEVHERTPEGELARSERRTEFESEAQRIFFEVVGDASAAVAPDIEALCNEHPRHASDLRLLHAHWKRAQAALGADWREPRGIPARYRVVGRIASGGMGEVLSVWDSEFGRLLAMKVLRASAGAQERSRAALRMRHEARILGRLQHPSIVPVHELGELESGGPYFTMLQVRGLALSEILPKLAQGEDGWTLPRVARILLQVCEAVAHAHSQGVLHRDLKPSNVMVGPFGETYVMDWGLAKARDLSCEEHPGADRSDHAKRFLTLDGEVLGTPAYMAPEQARGRLEEIGPHSDIYSAGAILYHLLALEAPFDGDSESIGPREMLERVLTGPPVPLARRARRAPPELIAICEKAMARQQQERYATMHEFAEDLRAWLEMRVVHAHARGAWAELKKWVQRNKGAAAAVSIGVLSLLALSVFQAVAQHREEMLNAERRFELYCAHLGLAVHALECHDGNALREHLAACPEDLRGWEWRVLARRADTSDCTFAHPGHTFRSIAWSQDGRWIAAGSDQGPVFLHEIASERVIELDVGSEVSALAFSRDGTRLFSGSKRGQVGIWDLERMTLMGSIEVGSAVHALVPGPEGQTVRVAAPSPMEFDLKTSLPTAWTPGTDVRVISCREDFTRNEGFRYPLPLGVANEDFERILVLRSNEPVQLIDARTGAEIGSRNVDLVPFRGLSVSTDGRWVSTTCDGRRMRLIELSEGGREIQLPVEDAWQIGWSRDSRYLFAGTRSAIQVWEVQTGALCYELFGHTSSLQSAAISSDGRWLASGCDGGELRLWNLHRPDRVDGVSISPTQVRQIAASPDGRAIGCVTLDGVLEVRDVATRARLHRIEDSAALECLAWSPSGERIATGARDGCIRVWNLEGEQLIQELDSGQGRLGWLAFLANGARLAHQPYYGGRIGVLDLESGASLWTLDESCGPATLSPDGTFIACVDDRGAFRALDPESGALLFSWQGGLKPVVEPQGIILSTDGGRAVLRYTWASGIALHSLDGSLLANARALQVSAFTYDGARMFANTADGVGVLDAYNARPILYLPIECGKMVCLPTGTLISGTPDGNLVWTIPEAWRPSPP